MADKKPLWIENDLHRRVKAAAALSGLSLKEWTEGILEDALADRPSLSALVDLSLGYSTEEAS